MFNRFLPSHREISSLKLERLSKNSQTCAWPPCLKLFISSHSLYVKSTFLSSACWALCDLLLLTLQSYLLTVFLTFCGSRHGGALVILFQLPGLAISCSSVKPCLNVILSRKPKNNSMWTYGTSVSLLRKLWLNYITIVCWTVSFPQRSISARQGVPCQVHNGILCQVQCPARRGTPDKFAEWTMEAFVQSEQNVEEPWSVPGI